MNTEQLQVRQFMVLAQQELPTVPTIPSLEVRILRAKLILEEALETIHKGLGLAFKVHLPASGEPFDFDKIEWTESPTHEPSLIEIADGCADLKVVTDGTALACGIDLEPVMAEVSRSNMSKFPCKLREDGKVLKNENWKPPQIKEILNAQANRHNGPALREIDCHREGKEGTTK